MMTRKQQRFVEEYCVDANATAAAKRATYSERTAHSIGSENLRKPEIRDAIAERMDRLSVGADEALLRLSQQARGLVPTKVVTQGDETREEFDTLHALTTVARIRGLLDRNGDRQGGPGATPILILGSLDEVEPIKGPSS